MYIKLRVRTQDTGILFSNDKLGNILAHINMVDNRFELFDNCKQIKWGQSKKTNRDAILALSESVDNKEFKECYQIVYVMLKNVYAHEDRVSKDPELNPSFHYNVVEWIDGKTNDRCICIFDTIVFILDDTGRTVEKIPG